MTDSPSPPSPTPGPFQVSVVMPTRDAAPTIGQQLEALGRQTFSGLWEIIVVDNGSTDGTTDVVESWAGRLPHLRLIEARERGGAAYARNAGCRAGCGELVLFCDSDDVVCSAWVAEMSASLRTFDAVGGRIERESLNDEVGIAARPPKPSEALLDTFGFLPYPLGANCGVRRETWERVGGFDESFDGASEDVDFFWRIQLSGALLGFVPDAVVHYRLRSDPRSIARQAFGFGISHPRLFRGYRAAGMPRSSLGEAGREWWWIVTRLPALWGAKTDRAVWLKRTALRCGRIVGSLSCRVAYL